MIQEQLQTSENHGKKTKLDLTVEESFFIELMEKLEPSVINIKYMKDRVQFTKIEQFLNYYCEQEIIQLLESLVAKGRVQKKEKGVVLLCPKCSGHAIMTLLMCPRCGSVKIGKREDLYHAECEYWGPKEEFIEGMLLRCPRCNELLDEDAPEGTPGYYSISDTNFECQDCGVSVSKNNLKMVCLKCNTKFTSIQTSYLNSVAYNLIPNDQVVLPKPKKRKPMPLAVEKTAIIEPEKPKKELEQEKKPESALIPTKTGPEIITESKLEKDIEAKPKKKPEPEKPGNKILQKSISKVSKLLKPKKKRKKKSKPKPKPKPEEFKAPQEVSEEPPKEPEVTKDISEPVVEEKKEPEKTTVKKVLLIVEDITVTEFIIESLEEVKIAIEVLHVDDGKVALKELRNKFDVIIMDLDLKTIDFKLILSEMEKWEITTPLIPFTDHDLNLEKYHLAVDAVLKKKQYNYRMIKKKIQSLIV